MPKYPSPMRIYRKALKKYEKTFRAKPPQWSLTLGRDDSRSLLDACERVGMKLPVEFLIGSECHAGEDSLWAKRQLEADYYIERKNMGRMHFRDLQNLPIDPAEMVARVAARNGKQK